MRLMLWSLLALNGVAAALWLAGVTVPAASRPAPPPPALAAKRLELLSELPSPPPRIGAEDDGSPHSPEPGLSAPAHVATDSATSPAAAQEAAKVEEEPPVAVAAPAVVDAVAPAPPASAAPLSASAANPAASAPAPRQETEPKPEPKPIEPERTAAPAPAAVETPAVLSGTSTVAGGAPDVVGCYRTAAFAPDARERVAAALQKAGLGAADLKSSAPPRQWVYWSGPPDAASSVEQALKASGVKDWYRVGGGREVTISLGVYGQLDGARRRQRELAAKAVQAQIAERYAPAARQRLQVKASKSAVESARATLERAGVRLEACPE